MGYRESLKTLSKPLLQNTNSILLNIKVIFCTKCQYFKHQLVVMKVELKPLIGAVLQVNFRVCIKVLTSPVDFIRCPPSINFGFAIVVIDLQNKQIKAVRQVHFGIIWRDFCFDSKIYKDLALGSLSQQPFCTNCVCSLSLFCFKSVP